MLQLTMRTIIFDYNSLFRLLKLIEAICFETNINVLLFDTQFTTVVEKYIPKFDLIVKNTLTYLKIRKVLFPVDINDCLDKTELIRIHHENNELQHNNLKQTYKKIFICGKEWA